ncbi:hypothetical protein Pcinc_012454 [Petrolisthes cinctipes]|uniref:Uncharacterized protein n=1 Tax=Petrolisthes cinctipes TaxID=88211 RepID=A0AAE1FYX4_PETCI|nr:hypothetical protein Pcinc_012454 [Petrolisthes cinctipes]
MHSSIITSYHHPIPTQPHAFVHNNILPTPILSHLSPTPCIRPQQHLTNTHPFPTRPYAFVHNNILPHYPSLPIPSHPNPTRPHAFVHNNILPPPIPSHPNQTPCIRPQQHLSTTHPITSQPDPMHSSTTTSYHHPIPSHPNPTRPHAFVHNNILPPPIPSQPDPFNYVESIEPRTPGIPD